MTEKKTRKKSTKKRRVTPGKKNGPAKGEGGRPLLEIEWNQVDQLCAIHCTLSEISEFLDISEDTIVRACKREKGIDIGEYIARKSLRGKMSLRRRQWKSAEAGDRTMLVWLGKQWLGQADKIEQVSSQEHKVVVYLPDNGRK